MSFYDGTTSSDMHPSNSCNAWPHKEISQKDWQQWSLLFAQPANMASTPKGHGAPKVLKDTYEQPLNQVKWYQSINSSQPCQALWPNSKDCWWHNATITQQFLWINTPSYRLFSYRKGLQVQRLSLQNNPLNILQGIMESKSSTIMLTMADLQIMALSKHAKITIKA